MDDDSTAPAGVTSDDFTVPGPGYTEDDVSTHADRALEATRQLLTAVNKWTLFQELYEKPTRLVNRPTLPPQGYDLEVADEQDVSTMTGGGEEQEIHRTRSA